MPVYAYQCKKCGHEFDELKSIADRKIPTEDSCINCSEYGVELKINAPKIVSSDGNFYSKIPGQFKERLKEIKKTAGKTSTIDV